MQTRRATSALALVLPHPPLPRRRSSYSSMSSAHSVHSPHTPRSSCGPQTPLMFKFDTNGPRTSTDSWASSTQEVDEMEWEWNKDQISLLTKTLESLPQHVLTPFAGPIPPSNLLDKVARSIASSKGAMEWPHSVRATRAKLIDLSREKQQSSKSARSSFEDVPRIPEEKENEVIDPDENMIPVSDEDSTIGKAAGRRKAAAANVKSSRRKPLYRQNSMDFLGELPSVGDSLPRLSSRLQRTSRILSSSTYHPYARPAVTRSPSPMVAPIKLGASKRPALRRASTSLSVSTVASSRPNSMPAPPSPQPPANQPLSPTRRSLRLNPGSVSAQGSAQSQTQTSIPVPLRTSRSMMTPSTQSQPKLKRAPSYGAVSVSHKMKGMKIDASSTSAPGPAAGGVSVIPMERPPSCVSSDEEEKTRTAGAKRARTRTRSGGSTDQEREKVKDKKEKPSTAPSTRKATVTPSPPSSPTRRSRRIGCTTCATKTEALTSSDTLIISETTLVSANVAAKPIEPSPSFPRLRPRVRVRRSDSMFGAPLHTLPLQDGFSLQASPTCKPIPGLTIPAPVAAKEEQPTSRPDSPPKSLRRVNKASFPARPSRRISFGSLQPPDESVEVNGEPLAQGKGLESAFTLA